MVIKWIQESRYAAIGLLLCRLYLGWQWLAAGWGKLAGSAPFDASGFVQGAVANPVLAGESGSPQYPIYVDFLQHWVLPHVGLFNALVVCGEVMVGVGLILGCFTSISLFSGLVMNFAYLLAGAISLNPVMILLSIVLLLGGPNSEKLGIGRPLLRQLQGKLLPDRQSMPS